jgi:hypothetical protein
LPYGDDDKRALGGGVRSYLTGSARHQTRPFEDTLGEGRKTVLAHAVEEAGLELEMALFCYDRLPLLGLEAEVRNVGRDDYPLAEIILGEASADRDGGFSLGVPPQRCSMLGNGILTVVPVHMSKRLAGVSPQACRKIPSFGSLQDWAIRYPDARCQSF